MSSDADSVVVVLVYVVVAADAVPHPGVEPDGPVVGRHVLVAEANHAQIVRNVAGAENQNAVIAQSGSITLALAEDERHLGFSYLVTCGNEAVLGVGDYLDYIVRDDRVCTVLIFVESIRNPARALRCSNT